MCTIIIITQRSRQNGDLSGSNFFLDVNKQQRFICLGYSAFLYYIGLCVYMYTLWLQFNNASSQNEVNKNVIKKHFDQFKRCEKYVCCNFYRVLRNNENNLMCATGMKWEISILHAILRTAILICNKKTHETLHTIRDLLIEYICRSSMK